MLKCILAGVLLFAVSASFAQDVQSILKKSYSKCQSVQNGYYEMDSYWKPMSEKDTFKTSINCYFQKLKNDSLHPSAFHTKHFFRDRYTGDILYTGDDMVRLSSYDSTATLMSKTLWKDEIKDAIRGVSFCTALTDWNRSFMPPATAFTDKKYTFKFMGEEVINQNACYHIRMDELPESKSGQMMKMLRIERNYWIKKEDFIPVQYSTVYEGVMSKDTMYDYQKFVFTKYEINNLKDQQILTLSSIPTYYKLKDYVPSTHPEPLPKDTIAPGYTLLSLTDQKTSLADFKGKVVLLDFFYKACYPCMQALPGLQALHEKYKDKGLQVMGIDPFDKKEDGLAAFLSKRSITYNVLLGAENVAKDYRVFLYPTMYLIDKNGKIIFVQSGYYDGVDKALEEIIRKNL